MKDFCKEALMLSALFMLLVPNSSEATEYRCDNCSEQEYLALAKQNRWGTHYVYDLAQGHVRKYRVESEPDRDGMYLRFVYPQSVESDVKNVVLELSAYHTMTAGSMSSHYTFYADEDLPPMDAFDVAGPGGPRTQLYNWLGSADSRSLRNALPMVGANIQSLVGAALSILKNNLGPVHVTVVFTDGSEVTVSFELINNEFEVIEGTARDSAGNVVPATLEDLDGMRFNYDGGSDGLARGRMSNYLYTMWGVETPSESTGWACVTAGDSVSCHAY